MSFSKDARCLLTRRSAPQGASIRTGRFAPEQLLLLKKAGENGGAYRNRTDDILLAKQALSQLS